MEGWLLQLPQVWQPCQKVSFQWVLAGGDNPDELGPSSFPGWHQPSSSQLLRFEFRDLCAEGCSGDRQHSPTLC